MSALPLAQLSPVDIGPRAAAHALNRLGYGPRPGDLQRVLSKGLERWIDEQLDPPSDPDLQSRLQRFTTLNWPLSQVAQMAAQDQRSVAIVLEELYSAKVVRAAHGQNQLQEVLTDFWFNHFNVYALDGFLRVSTAAYERDAIRPNVLGTFRTLLGATANHPAMMFYLDNYLSTVSRGDRNGVLQQGLNENYGRELMELHTVSVDAGYTQAHVFDAARCFTGWGIDQRSGAFVYRPQNHDTGAKSVFGLGIPAGGQKQDGDRLLDYLASHPATAHFVSKKLCQRFVADDPPDAVVQRCADTFSASGGDIAEVMGTIVGSAEFWSAAFEGTGKPKTPFECAISALRAAGAEVTTGIAVVQAVAGMGMPQYQCIPPTGYSNRGEDWLDASSHLNRVNFGLDLAAGLVRGVGVDAAATARSVGADPSDPRSIATALDVAVFGRRLSRETLDAVSRVASSSGQPNAAARALGLVLGSPEMQVR